MSQPWNAQQREWLRALGHPLLVLAGSAARTASPVLESIDAVPSSSSETLGPAAGLKPESRSESKREPKLEPRARSDEPRSADDLYRALLRATGQRPADAEQALRQFGIESAALRGNPAGKRALWPRLRRLRARRPT